jgi:hypothetical protein
VRIDGSPERRGEGGARARLQSPGGEQALSAVPVDSTGIKGRKKRRGLARTSL